MVFQSVFLCVLRQTHTVTSYALWGFLILTMYSTSQHRYSCTALREYLLDRRCIHSSYRGGTIENKRDSYKKINLRLRRIESRTFSRSILRMMLGGSDITIGTEQLMDRAGALDKAAGYIQKLYWAQFADDSYTGRRRIDSSGTNKEYSHESDNPMSEKYTKKEQSIYDENNGDYSKMPRAPTTEPLIPATGVRYQIHSIVDVLRNYDAGKLSYIELLDQVTLGLNSSELSSTKAARRAFNKYTQAIRFGDSFQINLPEGSSERRRYIQDNDRLLTAETVITANLDLRDLHRNQILTNLDDLRAETEFLKTSFEKGEESTTEDSLDELRQIVSTLVSECDMWFSFIPSPDVEKAYAAYIELIQQRLTVPLKVGAIKSKRDTLKC